MSAGDRPGPSTPSVHAPVTAASLSVLVVLALGLAVFGLVAAGSTTAQTDANASSGPELGGGEKLNTTAVEVLVVDSEGVETASISADDFLLSDGDLAGVSATTEGTNASVTLVLEDPVPADELIVGVASDSGIRDVNGTRIRTDQTVTIAGMDGVPPRVLGTDVSDAVGGPADIEFRFDEPVSALAVEVTGPENVTLDVDDFENPLGNRYVTEYEPPESGEYRVSLRRITDEAGNTRNLSVVRTVEADRSDPEAVIGIDFGTSSGTNVTFDATDSEGNRLEYTWEFGDGTTDRGERVTHEFTPEEHTVTLTVEDGFGNTDRDRIDLNLTDGLETGGTVMTGNGTADPAVIVDRNDPADSRNTLVSITGALAGEWLDVGTAGDSERPLLDHGALALDRLSIRPAVNTSFSVALAVVGSGNVAGAASGDAAALGGFTVLSDVRPAELSDTEFTFSVDAARLDTLDLSPAAVELRREVDGEWRSLDTTVLNESGEQVQFVAPTPGFSRFAIVGTPGDEGSGGTDGGTEANASIEVTDATVAGSTVAVGETVQVTATVENAGERGGTFRAGLELDGNVVETRDVEVAANGSESVAFTPSFDEPGTVAVAVNGTVAGEVTVENATEDGLDVERGAFTVANVTLNATSIDPGESVRIEADVVNERDETADYIAELQVDGEVVDTYEVPKVPSGEDVPVRFTRQFEGKGTYTISFNGTGSGVELAVGQGGGSFGFLPLGLLQTVAAFVGIPLVVLYLVLKTVAFYLGY